jgi:hypothetical protein
LPTPDGDPRFDRRIGDIKENETDRTCHSERHRRDSEPGLNVDSSPSHRSSKTHDRLGKNNSKVEVSGIM